MIYLICRSSCGLISFSRFPLMIHSLLKTFYFCLEDDWEDEFDDEEEDDDEFYDWHGETGDFTKKYNAVTSNTQQV